MSICCNLLKNIKNHNHYLKTQVLLYNVTAKCSTNASGAYLSYEKDPAPYFTDKDTQQILKSITRMNFDKIFRTRTVSDNMIEYKFMTTEQIESEIKEAGNRAQRLLQMPPIVKITEDTHKIISKDPALKSFSDSSFVITDITYGIKDSDRTIVIRHDDGVLEHAPLSIRKRVNQIYFPLSGRRIRMPKMFEEKYLNEVLDEHKYEFVLDRLCVQFEPYEREFHMISSKVYQHINENKKFDDLRSTRHFGPMAFFLAWHKLVDDLLLDMIKRDYLRNCVELISLTYKLNNVQDSNKDVVEQVRLNSSANNDMIKESQPTYSSVDIHHEINSTIGKSAADFTVDDLCLNYITEFNKLHGVKKTQLELAIQAYRETNDQKKKLLEGLSKAHGIS